MVKGKVVENMKGLRDILLGLDRCVSPGTGGLRGEFLTDLAEGMDQSQMDLLEEFVMKFLCGILPPWFYKVWLSVQTVPLYKAGGAVRPLGIRNQLLKSFHRETVTQNREVFTNFLEPQQLAMSRGGGAKLVFSVRTLLEERPDFVAVKVDMRNAFNEVSRTSVIRALEEEPSLQHMAQHAAVVLASHHGLECRGCLWV